MSEPSLQDIFTAIKTLEQKLEDAQENNLSVKQIAKRLGRGVSNKNFVPTKQAAEAFSISPDVLKDRVDNKEFKHGEHYIDIRGTGSVKPVYLWNIEAILEYWQTPPEYRTNKPDRRSRRTLKAVS